MATITLIFERLYRQVWKYPIVPHTTSEKELPIQQTWF